MLSIPLNNRLIEKIESRSAISAVSLKKKKPKKDVVKINSKVCDVEADEMMNHTIPAPVHVAVPFMISTAMAEHVCDSECSEKDHNEEISCCFPLLSRERIRLFSRSKENNSRQIL
ncbi:uncharacterized protein LOC111111585 isoform X11 [Crassostrea virginica]